MKVRYWCCETEEAAREEAYNDLLFGYYDGYVADWLVEERPDEVEDLAARVSLECWGESDDLSFNPLFVDLVADALVQRPRLMLEVFGVADRLRELWWKARER